MLAVRMLPPPFSASAFKSKPLLPPSPFLPLQNPNFPIKLSPMYAQKKEVPKEGEEEEAKKNERPRLNLKWAELVLDRDPDNIVAVGLTGLLTWASVQVLWQLLVISAAIVVAALKYTIVAALLLIILITLL